MHVHETCTQLSIQTQEPGIHLGDCVWRSGTGHGNVLKQTYAGVCAGSDMNPNAHTDPGTETYP